jgi:TusA-related sulfurtransferase
MKRMIVFAALFALLAASPALACDGDKAKSEMAWKQVKPKMEKLDDGVRLTFASSDGAMIEKIEAAAKSGKILSCAGQCPMKVKTIKRNVKVKDGHVILTATSELPEMASYLQEQATKLAGARKAEAQTASSARS